MRKQRAAVFAEPSAKARVAAHDLALLVTDEGAVDARLQIEHHRTEADLFLHASATLRPFVLLEQCLRRGRRKQGPFAEPARGRAALGANPAAGRGGKVGKLRTRRVRQHVMDSPQPVAPSSMQKGVPDSGAAAPPAGGFAGKLPVADLPLFRFPLLVALVLPGEECFGSLIVTASVIGRRYRDVPDGPEEFVQERLPALFEIVMPAAKEKVVLFSEEGRHQQEVVPKVEEREAGEESLDGKCGGFLFRLSLCGGKRRGVKNMVGIGRKENGHGRGVQEPPGEKGHGRGGNNGKNSTGEDARQEK